MNQKLYFFLLILFNLIFINWGFAQVEINQDFDSTPSGSLPIGWLSDPPDNTGFSTTTQFSCNNNSAYDGISLFQPPATLTSPSSSSNGFDVSITFDYKFVNDNGSSATSMNGAEIYIEYSTDNGINWPITNIVHVINNGNYSSSTNCTSLSFTIPAINVPSGSNMRLRFRTEPPTSGFNIYRFYVDNIHIFQENSSVPECNSIMTFPTNGAPITTNQIQWTTTDGATGYRVSMGTTPGGTDIADNINVGNTTSYNFSTQLNYQTTYYVIITPYNGNGNAVGCSNQTFTTESPITTPRPWEEPFQNYGGPPIIPGWTIQSGFVVRNMPNKFAINPNNLNGYAMDGQILLPPTLSFQTISVGAVQSGDLLEFDYAFAAYNLGGNPTASDAAIRVYVSTNYGISYPSTPIATIQPDGTNQWRDFSYDLSAFAGQFVKIKIETEKFNTAGVSVGFDNFYIGQEITCERAENVELVYVGSTSAQTSWDAVTGASSYDWMLFYDGADPDVDTPVFSGNTTSTTVTLNNLAPGTEYDFYVRTDCGANGESYFSNVLHIKTLCAAITDFPFLETFEDSSPTRDCWQNEYVVSGALALDWRYIPQTDPNSIINAYEGVTYAIFQRDVKDGNSTKLVSVPLDLSGVSSPKLSFWYVNMFNADPQVQSINTLKVYYKTSANGNWIQLGTDFTSDVSNWTNVEFDLPNPSSEYYIAFEGINDWGLGIGIDAAEVYDDYTCLFETTWDGSDWSNGLPDADTKAIITGDLVLEEDLTACQVEVTATGSVEIPSNLTLTVIDRITNLATSEDFIVHNEANLVQERDVENIGEIRVHRIGIPYKRLDYTIWGSPVLGQELKAFSPMTVNNRIMTYNGTDGYVEVPNIYADFLPGQGVLFRAPNNWSSTIPAAYEGIFRGVPQNGTYTYPTYVDSYTSIGNPYPSNLDAMAFFEANPKAETLYFWTNINPVVGGNYSGHNYATINVAGGTAPQNGGENETPNGIISVGQGFVVRNSSSEVRFTNEMRTDASAPFFKFDEIERHRYWLNLTDENDYGFNQILIAYMTGATEGIDRQMDAKMMSYGGSALYQLILEQPFIIQGRPLPFSLNDRITLGFKADHDGRFKISLAHFDGLFESTDVTIFIKDLKTEVIHSLSAAPYEFEEIEGNYMKRFELFYIPQKHILQTDEYAADGVMLYKNKDFIEILSEFQPMNSVEIFDLSGRKIWSDLNLKSDRHSILSTYFGSQVLLIQVKLENGKMVSKKWVN